MDLECLLSRQPIYDSSLSVAGYELRLQPIPGTNGGNGNSFSLSTMFTEQSLDEIVGEHPGIINLTPDAIAGGAWKTIPKSRVVLACSEPIPDSGLPALTSLAANGYRLALSEPLSAGQLETLGNLAHLIRIDIANYLPDDLERRIRHLRNYRAKLLSENVGTYDEMEFSKSLGFDFFQGFFLCKSSKPQKELPVNRLPMIRLLAKIQDPELDMAELETMISQDLSLTYKLLRYANSAAVALPRTVTSAGHAVRLVGLEILRTWATALLLSAVEDKPRELMTTALVRARMCEQLAAAARLPGREGYVSAGMLSVLDALMDCPMERLLSELPLADEIKRALIEKSGTIGEALKCTIAYEQACWDDLEFRGLPLPAIRDSYLQAIAWAKQLTGGLLN